MKRVLIFSLAYYPRVGGAEVSIKEITDRLPDIQFHLLTMRFGSSPKEERIGNLQVHRLGGGDSYLSKILFVPRAALAARRLHRKEHFDAAWAMMSYMVLPLSLLRLGGVNIPYVLNLQDGDPFRRVFGRWFILPVRPLLAYGFRHAAIAQVLSNYLSGWAGALGYRGPVVVIPNGADSERFAKASPVDVGKKEGETWLVTSSRLERKNAIDDVIRALPLLPERVKFLVLGSGSEGSMLKTLVGKLGVQKRVRFLGHVPHAQLPGYLKACDIFVRPSRTEGFGASFAEAMAAGLPVIATQEGGIADFLFDRKRNPGKTPTGFAVDKDSPEQIAATVEDILANPEQARSVAEAARVMVRERYDWNVIARRMKEEVLEPLFSI